MAEFSSVGVLTAFVAGIISFLSPCVLPLVPGYISYVAGGSLEDLTDERFTRKRLAAIYLSIFFVLGFTAVFVAFGASASAIGEFLLRNKAEFELGAGIVVILFGLYMTGLLGYLARRLNISLLDREARFMGRIAGGNPASAFVLGMAFAFGWTPCIGPVLGAILTLSASTGNIAAGVSLLAIYSLGLGVPFLVAAAFTGFFLRRMKALRKISRPFQIGAGAILVVMGVAMLTGRLSEFAFWLLDTFPVFARIG